MKLFDKLTELCRCGRPCDAAFPCNKQDARQIEKRRAPPPAVHSNCSVRFDRPLSSTAVRLDVSKMLLVCVCSVAGDFHVCPGLIFLLPQRLQSQSYVISGLNSWPINHPSFFFFFKSAILLFKLGNQAVNWTSMPCRNAYLPLLFMPNKDLEWHPQDPGGPGKNTYFYIYKSRVRMVKKNRNKQKSLLCNNLFFVKLKLSSENLIIIRSSFWKTNGNIALNKVLNVNFKLTFLSFIKNSLFRCPWFGKGRKMNLANTFTHVTSFYHFLGSLCYMRDKRKNEMCNTLHKNELLGLRRINRVCFEVDSQVQWLLLRGGQ